jgi:hypothetical protein
VRQREHRLEQVSRPAPPAAEPAWPLLLFIDPQAQEPGRGADAPPPAAAKARVSAATSMGSPTGVALPWASTYCTVSGATPAAARASAITSAWPSSAGAV